MQDINNRGGTIDITQQREKLILRVAGLRVIDGPDKGKSIEIGPNSILIGTSPDCDLVLSDPTVSSRHANVVVQPSGYLIRDLGSRNGVIAGAWRAERIFLSPGMTLRLGKTTLIVEDLSKTAEVKLSAVCQFGPLLGRSVAMRRVFALLESAVPTDLTVLLQGESGTGKGLVAEALHHRSAVADGPFEVFDCAVVPPDLVESQLFGHEKGSFTGASDTHIGAVERADGGTLFLDEIGDLPINLQPKLLRLADTRQFQRVGGRESRRVSVRLVAATHHKLAQMVARGKFRQDLFFRLAVLTIDIPPLRERVEDIRLLVKHFCQDIEEHEATRLLNLVPLLTAYDWPGNVRELRNVIDRLKLIPPEEGLPTPLRPIKEAEALTGFTAARDLALAQFERRYVTNVLLQASGNVTRAAEIAGVSRRYLARLIARHQIDRLDLSGDDDPRIT